MSGVVYCNSGGQVQSLTGSEYTAIVPKTKTLYVRTGTGANDLLAYGLTTNTSASIYSPVINVNGTKHYIARKEIEKIPTTVTAYNTITRNSVTSIMTSQRISGQSTTETYKTQTYPYQSLQGSVTQLTRSMSAAQLVQYMEDMAYNNIYVTGPSYTKNLYGEQALMGNGQKDASTWLAYRLLAIWNPLYSYSTTFTNATARYYAAKRVLATYSVYSSHVTQGYWFPEDQSRSQYNINSTGAGYNYSYSGVETISMYEHQNNPAPPDYIQTYLINADRACISQALQYGLIIASGSASTGTVKSTTNYATKTVERTYTGSYDASYTSYITIDNSVFLYTSSRQIIETSYKTISLNLTMQMTRGYRGSAHVGATYGGTNSTATALTKYSSGIKRTNSYSSSSYSRSSMSYSYPPSVIEGTNWVTLTRTIYSTSFIYNKLTDNCNA